MSRLIAGWMFTALASSALADTGALSLAPLRDRDWTRDCAAHLLRRAGFGGTPQEVDRLHALGIDGAVSYLVDFAQTPYELAPPQIDPELRRLVDPERKALSEDERQADRERRKRLERRTFEEIRGWWVRRLAESPRPFEERMTLFWHGRFTSGFREVQNPVFMLEQNQLLRRLALGNYRDLLIGISKDRAMLRYLDNAKNRKQSPNENFARELMELFTLGEGNYTETDVREAARAFTGWTLNDDGFVFRAALHDDGVKTVLGRTGPLDGTDVIDAILDRPHCAQHLAGALVRSFVSPTAHRRLIDGLAAEIRRQNYELKPVVKTLLRSRAFYDLSYRGQIVKSPVEAVIGAARTLGVPIASPFDAQRVMAAMGQELMQPPNVKGWDGGMAWINTATLFERYNAVGRLIHGGQGDSRILQRLFGDDTKAERSDEEDRRPLLRMRAARRESESGDAMQGGMMSAMESVIGKAQPPFDPATWIESFDLDTPEKLVRFFEAHLLAKPLSNERRAVLLEYAAAAPTGVAARKAEHARTLIQLICSTPEFQLN